MGGGKGSKTPKPTAQEIALANVATKKFARYNKLYRPLIAETLKDTAMTANKVNQAKGLAHADLMSQTKNADKALLQKSLGAGFNVGDNRSVLARGQNQITENSVGGMGAAGARVAVRRADQAGRTSHIQLGHGLAGQTQQSMVQQAQSATAAAIQSAQIDVAEGNMIAEGFGTAAGLAYGSGGGPQFGQPATPQRTIEIT